MPRRKSDQITPLELEIMHVLWRLGAANVQLVQQELERQLAYTTVQTMLTVLHRKGKVKRVLKNKAYVYRPTLSQSKVTGHAVGELIDRWFGGSAEGLIMNLIEARHLTPKKLARLNQMLAEGEGNDQN
jgi:BlaI family transcriptional regulator, penicillinase repressor